MLKLISKKTILFYMQDLRNKNVIVCAGSTGIGKGVTSVLAKLGLNITTFSRIKEKLDNLRKEIFDETGIKINGLCTDLTKEDDLIKVVDPAHKYGKIDFPVMNYRDI